MISGFSILMRDNKSRTGAPGMTTFLFSVPLRLRVRIVLRKNFTQGRRGTGKTAMGPGGTLTLLVVTYAPAFRR